MGAPADPKQAQRQAIEDAIATSCAIARRKSWGARTPTGTLDPDWNFDSVVIHYTGHGDYPNMNSIQNFDMDHRKWQDIAYHYAVWPQGQIVEGREIIYKGSNVRNQNTGKIGIVCVGDFDSSIMNLFSSHPMAGDPIQTAMLASVERLTRRLQLSFPIQFFGGHLEYGESETCPGSKLLEKVKEMRQKLNLKQPVFKKV